VGLFVVCFFSGSFLSFTSLAQNINIILGNIFRKSTWCLVQNPSSDARRQLGDELFSLIRCFLLHVDYEVADRRRGPEQFCTNVRIASRKNIVDISQDARFVNVNVQNSVAFSVVRQLKVRKVYGINCCSVVHKLDKRSCDLLTNVRLRCAKNHPLVSTRLS